MHHFHSWGLDDAATLMSWMKLWQDLAMGDNLKVQKKLQAFDDGGLVGTVGTED